MASLRFHKVKSLPASYTVGDVYYVEGQGIYVATSTSSCTRFSYANDASTSAKGVTQLSDAVNSSSSSVAATSKAVKDAYDRGSKGINDAAAAKTAAENAQATANGKWTAKDASTSEKGIMQVGTGLGVSSGTVSVAYGSTAGTACEGNDYRLSNARTPVAHNQASNTITTMTGYAKASTSAAIATDDSLNAAIGKLEKGVEDAKSAADNKEPITTAVRHTASTAVGSATQPIYVDKNGNATACSYTIQTSVPPKAVFTDTHNKHTVSFTDGNAGDSTGDSVVVVTGVAGSTTGSDTTISASTTRTKVPTLAVTNGLATRISSLETLASTGMQYKGSISSIGTSTTYVAGSVYRVSTVISIPAAQSATGSAITAEVGDFIVCSTAGTGTAAKWDVWQANVNKDAYWDTNTPASGQIVVADGVTGKIKTTGWTTGSFDVAGAAATEAGKVLGTSNDAAGTATVYGALASAAAAQTAANSKEPTSTAVRHTAGTAFGSTSKPVYVDSTGAVKECSFTVQTSVPTNAKFTDTHHEAAFTINDGQSTAVAAQTFSQKDAKTLAIKAAATGNLTASTVSASANSGTLTINVGVASGYAIPTIAKATSWDNKWDKVVASTSTQGIMQVGTGLDVSSGTVSVKYGSAAGTACQGNDSRLSDARTPKAHNQASNTITAMTGYSKPSSASAIVVDDSLNAAIGKLEYKVDDAKTTATNKWSKAYAQALAAGDGNKAGVATFDSSSFTVSNVGHVGLAWATWATS